MDVQKDGRHENFIPVSKTVTVSMSLAEYEAERGRCKNEGFQRGERTAYRHLAAVFNLIGQGSFNHTILKNDRGLPEDEFMVLQELAKMMEEKYGSRKV